MLMWLSKQLCFYKYIWIWMDMDGHVHGKKDNVKNRLDCLSVTDKVHPSFGNEKESRLGRVLLV